MTPLSRHGSASSPRLWLGFCIAGALALGSLRLTHKDLWVDEAASAGFALGGPSAWIADHNMALYYMLLSAWVRVFGISELALRAPSVLGFAISVPLVYAVARASFGEPSARIASALHVGNAFMVQFAQEARGYMLAVVLVLSAQLALLRLLERPAPRYGVWYALSIGLAAYAHLFAAWTLLAHGLVLAPHVLRRGPARAWLLAALGLATLITLPLMLQVASASTAQVSWIRPLTLHAVLALPVIWTGGGAALGTVTCLLFSYFARGVAAREERSRLQSQLCVASVLVPLLAATAISLSIAPMLLPKYLIAVVPALQLGAAAALAQAPKRWRLAACALLLLLSLECVHGYYTKQQKERWREAVQYLDEHMLEADALILDLPSPEPLDYYVRQRHLDERWPAPSWPVRAWRFPTADEQPVTRADALAQLSRESPDRIWLIHNRSTQAPDLGALAAHYRVTSEEQLLARGDAADALFGAPGALLISIRSLTRTEPR